MKRSQDLSHVGLEWSLLITVLRREVRGTDDLPWWSIGIN
jgi:hypothetical protein